MSIFRLPRWLRRLVRRNMNPMGEEQAWKAKDKFAIAYAIIAWNAVGFVFYRIFNEGKSWPLAHGIRKPEEDMIRPAVAWAHTLGIKNASVRRISGLSISREEKIDLDKVNLNKGSHSEWKSPGVVPEDRNFRS